MALVIEDGTGKPDANSYGNTDGATTIVAVRTYALDRGVTLSADNADVTAKLINGTDFLETYARQYVGQVNSTTQALSWPRKNVCIDLDTLFPNNQIPTQLVNALYQAVIEQQNGIDLSPSVDHSQGGFILEEKVDVLDTKYSEKVGTSSQPELPKIFAMLQSLLKPIAALRTVRI